MFDEFRDLIDKGFFGHGPEKHIAIRQLYQLVDMTEKYFGDQKMRIVKQRSKIIGIEPCEPEEESAADAIDYRDEQQLSNTPRK